MKAVVIGYSGHSFVVIDTLLSINYEIIGYCEQNEKINNPYDLAYLGSETNLEFVNKASHFDFFLALGDNKIRAKVYSFLLRNSTINFPSAIHSESFVSNMASLGNGTVVMPGAVINALATVGEAVICNSASVIEHECQIGNFVHIAPGAVLAGNVTIGEGTFIGANAVIKQGIKIGENVTVGAGAVITKNISDGLTVFGNPAIIK